MAKKKLPLMVMKINPKEGSMVKGISIVGEPAIQSNFISFSNDATPERFEVVSEERMELLGAAMIPDYPMYRNTKGIGEYMSVFLAEDIRQIAQVFAERGFFNNMNIDHNKDVSAGSYVFQSYIVDSTKGISAPTGIDVPDGTWIVGVKVNDPAVWADIKSGKTNGFSVEGFFDIFDVGVDLELSLAEEFERLLLEFENERKGCLMFFPEVDINVWSSACKRLLPDAKDIETEPHVTILYGFVDSPEVVPTLQKFLAEAVNLAPIGIELGTISKFQNADQDVIKINVIDMNGSLFALNAVLTDMFGVISTFKEYHPHMTIAYTEPTPERAFSSDRVWPWSFGIEYLSKGKIIYSDASGIKTEIITIK